MKQFYKEVIRTIEGDTGAIATIIFQSGSSPRGLGAQMLIRADGSAVGSVGGGRLEAEVMEAAQEVMEKGHPKRLEFHLTGQEVADSDMICGGEVEVLLEPLAPQFLDLFKDLLELLERDKRALLFTQLPPAPWGKVLLPERGSPVGTLPKERVEEIQALMEKHPELWQQQRPFSMSLRPGVHLFVEPISSEPTLYLFGGGHVAQQIAPLAKMVGFKVVVLDDRPDYANRDRFPVADDIVVEDFARVAERVPVEENSYLVIVTRGHMHDYTVLKQFLRSPARYIGMIGSRRKRDALYRRLLEEGFSEEELARVHAPIGLDIGAETPEEIAVSVVAEMIKVRRSSHR